VSIVEITKEAVLAAVVEYDRLGADEFLKRYGFVKAGPHLLAHQGRQYDSKAIVGAAHGYLPGRPALKAADFSGGSDAVAIVLRDHGFEVHERRNSPWLEAELVLACDVVAQPVAGGPRP
jgi:5-methylcytosine-specific restriction protein A